MNKKKIITLAIVSSVLLIAIPLIIWLATVVFEVRQGIQVIVVPEKVVVTIDDKEYSAAYESKIFLEPGEYTIKMTADGFADAEQSVTVKQDEISPVYALLTPLTDEARRSINQSHYERIESGYRVNQGEVEVNKEYPFVSKLPIHDKYFFAYPCREIESDPQSNLRICVKLAIDNPVQRDKVTQTLIAQGIDVDSVDIHYVNPEEPITAPSGSL